MRTRSTATIALIAGLTSLSLFINAFRQSGRPLQIDDLNVSAERFLRNLPGVDEIEVKVRVKRPTHRIVHLRDWHLITRDSFAIDARNTSEKELTEEEINQLYSEFLLQVGAIQTEQLAILRQLIKDHGLKRIFVEGLSSEEVPSFLELVGMFRDLEQNQIPKLRKQLEEARELKADKIEQQALDMLDEHGVRLLQIGAAGRLLLAGEIEEVMPLENSVLYDNADPITGNKIRFDRDRVKAREDAQVKAVLDNGPFGLVILGGSHDLSESVSRLSHGRCEYIQVTTNRFREFALARRRF